MQQPQPKFPPSPDVCIPVFSLCPGLWDPGKLAPPPSTSHYLKRDHSIIFHTHNGKMLPHGKSVCLAWVLCFGTLPLAGYSPLLSFLCYFSVSALIEAVTSDSSGFLIALWDAGISGDFSLMTPPLGPWPGFQEYLVPTVLLYASLFIAAGPATRCSLAGLGGEVLPSSTC